MSFSITKQDAPFTDLQPYNPNSEINTASNVWEYMGKVSGAYTLPFDVMLAGNLSASTSDHPAADSADGCHVQLLGM